MEVTSDLIYIITIASSVGGSYLLMNYRTSNMEAKVKAMFKKIDELSSKIIIIGEKIKNVEKDREDIVNLTNLVNQVLNDRQNYLTLSTAESKFVTRNEFVMYTKNSNHIQEQIESEIEKLNTKLDKIYQTIINLSTMGSNSNNTS